MTHSREKGYPSRLIRGYLCFSAVLLILLIGFFTLFSIGRMVGSSMLPTIHNNTLFIIQKWGYTPKQGDIVVFEDPEFLPGLTVKRVVATGGQHVVVDYAANTVYVDGTALDEPYLLEPMVPSPSNEMSLLDTIVPDGSVYVLGDNRNNSVDSRDTRLGTVEEQYLLGRVVLILPIS